MKKAVIIGAGPAGVTAAYELLKKSDEYEVLVLEERRPGNRLVGADHAPAGPALL